MCKVTSNHGCGEDETSLKTINFYPEMFGGEIEIENNESNIICYNDLPPTITTKTDGFPTGAENGRWIRTWQYASEDGTNFNDIENQIGVSEDELSYTAIDPLDPGSHFLELK